MNEALKISVVGLGLMAIAILYLVITQNPLPDCLLGGCRLLSPSDILDWPAGLFVSGALVGVAGALGHIIRPKALR